MTLSNLELFNKLRLLDNEVYACLSKLKEMEQEKRTLIRPKIGLAKALLKTACVLLADGLITLAICCFVNYCCCELSLTAWIIMSISIFTVILTVVAIGTSHERIVSAHKNASFVDFGEAPLHCMLLFDEQIL